MGRCYEFGVVISEGCDHAMVVTDEGGACRCEGCGVTCTGRFSGCGAILAMPGHVPLAAPRRNVPRVTVDSPVPLLTDGGDAPERPSGLEMPAVVPGANLAPVAAPSASLAEVPRMAEVIDLFEQMLDRPDRTIEIVTQLRHELQTRDDELGQAFDRLTEAHTRIAEELVADREARERLTEAVQALAARLEAIEQRTSRPIFGVRRTSS